VARRIVMVSPHQGDRGTLILKTGVGRWRYYTTSVGKNSELPGQQGVRHHDPGSGVRKIPLAPAGPLRLELALTHEVPAMTWLSVGPLMARVVRTSRQP
jgi:hypothetical protein